MNRILALLALFLVGLAHPLRAEENHAKSTLHARVDGNQVKVAVSIQIEKGWHIYDGPTLADVGPEGVFALPTELELEAAGVTWGDWRFPKPEHETQDFGTPLVIDIHRGKIAVYRLGTASAGFTPESLKLEIRGQTCSEGEGGACVAWAESVSYGGRGPDALFDAFPKDIAATPQATPTPAVDATPAHPPSSAPSKAVDAASAGGEEAGNESSLLAFLLSAVAWGLFTLLMPCTYPMIPITISYFTKQADARKTSTLPLSLAYGAGIILIFVVIGLVAAPVIIPFATHPVTNLVIGGFFLVFALSLFGVMNLQPPAFLLNAAGSASQKGGYLGVFLMGATLVVTSFTCTAPFVGTLLSTGASSGSYGRVALGMAVFGATMAVPFVGLSMVPAKVKSMPKSGEWMHTLKVWLGFVEVAAALKFISNAEFQWQWGILPRELFLGLWGAIFAGAAAYLFGWIRLKDEYGQEDPASISPRRLCGGLATSMFALYCLYGMLGYRLDQAMTALAPPYSNRIDYGTGDGSQAQASGHPTVIDDFDAALEKARKENKLLLVNFTGFV